MLAPEHFPPYSQHPQVKQVIKPVIKRKRPRQQNDYRGVFPNLYMAGTVALGGIGYQVQNIACRRAAKQGTEIGPWLNPGYLDWPVTDQRLIFSLIPAQTIGVLLNDHCMMIPKKSVTVCAGIGISSASGDFNRCLHCGVEKCEYRRVTVNQKFDPHRLHDQLNPPGS